MEDQIQLAYDVLVEASDRGGDVSSLVVDLNEIILIMESDDYDAVEVSESIDEIISEATILAETAASENTFRLALRGVVMVIIVVLGYVVWRYFPTYYWRTWLNLRGNWLVE